MFVKHQINILYCFLKDHEDWSNDAENSALTTGINYTLLYIHIKQLFYTVIIFNNITAFCCWYF